MMVDPDWEASETLTSKVLLTEDPFISLQKHQTHKGKQDCHHGMCMETMENIVAAKGKIRLHLKVAVTV